MMNPYLRDFLLGELEDIVGLGNATDRRADRLVYARDTYWLTQMWVDRGLEPPLPDLVAFPETAEQVGRILRVAARHGVPVIPFGGGSGSQGGITPLYGGITLDLKRMDRVVCVDETSLATTAQAGIIAAELERQLNLRGLTLNHFPASLSCATLGGFIAHRGSGVLSTKYGKIDEMVLGLEVVLADGTLLRIPPVPMHSAGPNLAQLILGSEGTLGIVTEATLKVHRQPEARRFRGILFPTLRAGLEAGRRIMLARLRHSVFSAISAVNV